MYLAVITLNLAGFGLVVVSQWIWRPQFISATATASMVGSTMLGAADHNVIARSPVGGYRAGFDE
jgi:hypothetical protein